MSNYTKFDNKRILIWGYGREGKSTERFLQNNCAPACIDIFEGKPEEINDEGYDYVIKSPGIKGLYPSDKYTSQTQIFLEQYKDRVIGVTGTKGKSTTTALLYKILSKAQERPVLFVGNIGIPCLDYFNEVTDDALVVFELSCHQLNNITVAPHVAVFLNLFEEHLDYYGTIENYTRAKSNIIKFQQEGDYAYVGKNVPAIDSPSHIENIDCFDERRFDLKILGQHNQWNAQLALTIATDLFGCDRTKALQAMCEFEGLPHRLSHIASVSGIEFYDDSISTIPLATINAVNSIPGVSSCIIGGMDRGINYDELIDFISNCEDIFFILCYASGKRIYDSLPSHTNNIYLDNLDEAVPYIKANFTGGACVLSPAAASYGYFKDFAERGDYFKSLVTK